MIGVSESTLSSELKRDYTDCVKKYKTNQTIAQEKN